MMASSGCATKVHQLPERFLPLERVKESFLRPGTGVTTVGTTARVNDLDDWLEKHPPNGPRYDAILLHEREHSLRQLNYGLNAWLGRYLTDTEFMLLEEQIGWYIQIQEYRRRGVMFTPEGIARVMSKYRNFAGPMIDYEDALTWVRDVLAGRWSPPEGN